MNETTRRRSSRTVRFLTVAAVLFGIASTIYTYLLPQKITLPEYGISFKLPSPALISWHYEGEVEDWGTAYLHNWIWDRDSSGSAFIVVANAECTDEQVQVCTHEDVFDNVIQRRWNGDGEKKLVYLVPIENGDWMYSTVKGCNDDECAYQWRSEDDVIFVQYVSAVTPFQHDSCDVAMQKIMVHEPIVTSHYFSIRCESAHVLMYTWRVPEDEMEAIIASVAVLE